MNVFESILEDYLNKIKVDDVDKMQVEFISQSNFAFTSDKIRALCTQSLATCIGLLVFCDDFAFLAHIELGSLSDDFEQERFGNNTIVTWCNSITELLIKINIRKNLISSPINVCMILGCMPVAENNQYRQKIEQGLNITQSQCQKQGININRMPNLSSESVFFDFASKRLFIGMSEIDISDYIQSKCSVK